ncbi:hypothetical protein SMKI_06G3830 [Saccharomyces mikatae IFO 1815]|uniref:mannitol 2-dehydrogenase n=1 Tax=Saccharomyces mikatae IFO 1815 TaxID=226126 RepID=A0AA35NHU3_SACMI|nr:uncharacterized protein SMKI_06G3830 [Saccharomyces mikatae IFO 1815]CAI4039031.1 hypothetical protein SMKI_06G3830 [Saccharomyces mikatae IFO 1815]
MRSSLPGSKRRLLLLTVWLIVSHHVALTRSASTSLTLGELRTNVPLLQSLSSNGFLKTTFLTAVLLGNLSGVQVVKDVDSYELMKLRLLNGGHSAMGYLGYLAGYTYIHEVVNDPTINKYIRVLMREEVIPLLPKVPGVDFEEYTASVLERFSNPAIQDTVARICLMGSGKMPKYVLPSIYEQLRKPNGKYKLLAVCVAGWFRYLTGVDMNGKPFEIEDPMADTLKAAAVKGGKDPHELLNIEVLFSPEIRDNKDFVAQLTHSLEVVYDKGPLAAVNEVLDQV